jgi:hypothetical protein
MTITAPAWIDPRRPGLRSARQNVADGDVILQVTEALPSLLDLQVYYLVYFGETALPARPSLISGSVPITVPANMAGGDWLFAVSAANGAGLMDFPGLSDVGDNLYAFPDPVNLAAPLGPSDTSISFSTSAGYPVDGYIVIGTEILRYSGLSGDIASVSGRALNGTVIASHAAGAQVELWTGVEAVSADVRSIPSCGLDIPKWINPNKVGLEQAIDVGDGYTVILKWDYATIPVGFSPLYYQIFKSNDLKDLYDKPLYLTTDNEATLAGVTPKEGYYYGVRASYFLSDFTVAGMTSTGPLYEFPAATQLEENLLQGNLGSVQVATTAGYPDSGLLKLGHEIVRYSSRTPDSFLISARDVFALGWPEDLPIGTEIQMFRGVDDGASYFWKLNTSWDAYGLSALPLEPGDGYWGFGYLQDPDGYRNFPEAAQNEDHSIQEEDAANADPFDYCGFRSNDQSQLLSGDFCAPRSPHGSGTYHGNSALGQGGGIDLFEGNMERQEILLGITGEPFVLLRRKWTGKVCPRLSHRTEHPEARCSLCLGTSFEGGYDRYIHTRRLRPAEENPNGFLGIRVSPYQDELELVDSRGFSTEKTDLSAWTLALPTIRDRDILIRYSFDYETGRVKEEFRYEVLTVRRNRIALGKDGAQHLTLKRLNPTEEVYKFVVNIF